MRKVFLFVVALIVCTSFSFAADLESESFDVYSLDPLTNSALDYAVMPLATVEWTTDDSDNLQDIRDALYLNKSAVSGSIIQSLRDSAYLKTIFIGGSGTYANPQSGSALYYLSFLPNLVSLQTMEYNLDYIEETTSSISSDFSNFLSAFNYTVADVAVSVGHFDEFGSFQHDYWYGPTRPVDFLAYMSASLTLDGVIGTLNQRSLYSRIAQLQETLASDDDKALAESQKANREEIEDSFLTGSSGSTSLGASDFGDLSDVGGTVKDSISLNGQASVSSFTSGLAGADESGQGWFSAATRDSLDSVSGSVSTFALADPYNMAGWHNRYAWVEGD